MTLLLRLRRKEAGSRRTPRDAGVLYDAYLLPPGANFGGKGERQAERRTQGLAKTDEWAGDLVSALLIGDGVFGEHHVQRAEEKLSLLRLRFVPYKLPILVSIFYQFALFS